MVDPIRIPLVEDIEPRLAGSNKDGLASNVFYDKGKNNTIYAVKRPGITSYISGSGLAQGIYYYDGTVFDFSQLTPLDNPNTGTVYSIFGDTSHLVLLDSNFSPTLVTTPSGVVLTDGDLPIYTTNIYRIGSSSTRLVAIKPAETQGYYSDNGNAWTSMTMPSTASWSAVANNGTIWVAVSSTPSGTNNYATSSDGISWTLRSSNNLFNTEQIKAGNGIFVAKRAAGSSFYSTNGTTWTQSLASGVSTQNLYFDNGYFSYIPASTSVGVISSRQGRFSSDGITWITFTLPEPTSNSFAWRGFAWDGTYYFIVGHDVVTFDTYLAKSSDLTTWTASEFIILGTPGTSVPASISTVGTNIILASTQGYIMVSNNSGATFTYKALPEAI